MKINRIITTGVLALAISSFSTTAFATTSDATGTPAASDTSTTVPVKKDRAATSTFRSDMQAWQAATKTWVATRVAIMTEYRETVATASATLGAALNSATTKEEIGRAHV